MWTKVMWKSENSKAGTEIDWEVSWSICSMRNCNAIAYKEYLGMLACYSHYGELIASLY